MSAPRLAVSFGIAILMVSWSPGSWGARG